MSSQSKRMGSTRMRAGLFGAMLVCALAGMRPVLADGVTRADATVLAGTSTAAQGLPFEPLIALDDGRHETLGRDGARSDGLGAAVAVDGDFAVLGVPGDSIGTPWTQGSAYVYVRDAGGWRVQAKLVASDHYFQDRFGLSVAISGDSIVVGAPGRDVAGVHAQGAAYVFVRDGDTWNEQAQLTTGDSIEQRGFGMAVAIAGNTVLVTAPGMAPAQMFEFTRSGNSWSRRIALTAQLQDEAAGFGAGMAFDGTTLLIGRGAGVSALIYRRQGEDWVEEARVMPDDGLSDDQFGRALAVSGDEVVIGAPWHAHLGQVRRGAVYVYQRGSGNWLQQAKVVADDGVAEDRFGSALALRGDRLLVGANADFIDNGDPHARAYAYVRSSGQWQQRQRIEVPAPGPEDRFGTALALDDDLALIGAPERWQGTNEGQGAAFVYSWVGNAWQLDTELKTASGRGGELGGNGVAVSGDTVVVGMPGYAASQGAVQIYVRNGEAWLPQALLQAPDLMPYDEFGFSVAISGDTVLVGARTHAANGDFARGAAYVYTRAQGTWSLQTKLVSSDGGALDYFGHAVALQGNTAVVSAYLYRSLYVFVREDGIWREQTRIRPAEVADAHGFGYALALDDDTILVSASEQVVHGVAGAGAVYVYVRNGESWSQQAVLSDSDGGESHIFGRSIALDGDRAAIGSARPNVKRDGVMYIFERENGVWLERALFRVSEGSGEDIAASVALSGSTLVVGTAILNAGFRDYNGDAYVFRLDAQGWNRVSRLTRPVDDPSFDAYFGSTAALSGNTLVIGASGSDGPAPFGNPDSGTVYVASSGVFADGFE
jgi:hypothetical protein